MEHSETMENFGMQVTIWFHLGSHYFNREPTVLHNITEIHFNYNHHYDKDTPRIAFESYIHGNGMIYNFYEIKEFETALETEKKESF